jgi:hypothetical protein
MGKYVLKTETVQQKGTDGVKRALERSGAFGVLVKGKHLTFRPGVVYDDMPAEVLKRHKDRFVELPEPKGEGKDK